MSKRERKRRSAEAGTSLPIATQHEKTQRSLRLFRNLREKGRIGLQAQGQRHKKETALKKQTLAGSELTC